MTSLLDHSERELCGVRNGARRSRYVYRVGWVEAAGEAAATLEPLDGNRGCSEQYEDGHRSAEPVVSTAKPASKGQHQEPER